MVWTSSANPSKLKDYANRFRSSADPLTRNARTVSEAVENWNRAQATYHGGTVDVPPLGSGHADGLNSLLADLRHLNKFTEGVADGFVAAMKQGLSTRPGPVHVVSDGTIGQLGSVGYADRREATEAGKNAAAELLRMIDRGVKPADIQVMLARGKHDPAFAVAFSEQLRARGYVDAVGAIRMSYGEHNKVPVQGVEAAKALATTLTTALRTHVERPNAPGQEYVPDGDPHISPRFVADLTRDFDPYGQKSPGGKYNNQGAETDLSVLLRLSNPPKHIARQIGEHRLRPQLERALGRNADLRKLLEQGDPVGVTEANVKAPTSARGIAGSYAVTVLLAALMKDKPPFISDNYQMPSGAYRGWGSHGFGRIPAMNREDYGGLITNYVELLKRYPDLWSKY